MKKLTLLLVLFVVSSIFPDTPTPEEIAKLESIKIGEDISEDKKFIDIQTSVLKAPEEDCEPFEQCIYGYELFNKSPTTFALSSDVPVPPDYILGPGDQINIIYYGSESLSESIYIDRSGFINLPLLGPLNLSGLSIDKAQELINLKISEELIGTKVLMTLGALRSINVYLLGEAFKPGTYTVSALSTLTNILFASGGVSKIGSLRNIEIKRQGKSIGSYDFYKLLLSGDTSDDIKLQDGDTIFVPLVVDKVAINGSVMRPGFFEVKKGSIFKDILLLSGIRSEMDLLVEHNTYDQKSKSRKSLIYSVEEAKSLKVKDGDVFNVLDNIATSINTAELRGEFRFPGTYSIDKDDTLLDLINRAGGLTDDAYPKGAVFTRKSVAAIEKNSYNKSADDLEKSMINALSEGVVLEGAAYESLVSLVTKLRDFEPTGRQVIEADPFILTSQPSNNIKVQHGDVLTIPKVTKTISVVGEVLSPISHLYSDNYNVDDYLSLSGGLTDGADKSKIFVISPNGQARLHQSRLFSDDLSNFLLPGSTIVVTRDAQPFDWLSLTGVVAPILSDLAVSAAAIAAINDNN